MLQSRDDRSAVTPCPALDHQPPLGGGMVLDLERCGIGDVTVAVAEAAEAEALTLGAASGEAIGDVAGRGTGVKSSRRGCREIFPGVC